jgi:hypothetical protein
MTAPIRCGICGGTYSRVSQCIAHDLAKHALFEKMQGSRGVIEPLSPLANDLHRAREADKARAKP